MHHGGKRPYEDGPEITFTGTQPVDETACEKAHPGIEKGEETGDPAIVGVAPVEFGSDEILPRQRKHLTVKIVDRRGEKEKGADHPTPVGGTGGSVVDCVRVCHGVGSVLELEIILGVAIRHFRYDLTADKVDLRCRELTILYLLAEHVAKYAAEILMTRI